MKQLIQLEEILFFIGSIFLFTQLDLAWWWFIALIFTPDISMIAYLVNSKIGAITYNIFHHRGLAIAILIIGWQTNAPIVSLCGIILFGHASLDRIFAYGLKYFDGFKNKKIKKIA